jgi:hypothetical protein
VTKSMTVLIGSSMRRPSSCLRSSARSRSISPSTITAGSFLTL